MPYRRYWLLFALLLPLLLLSGGNCGAAGLTNIFELSSGAAVLKGQPLDHRHAIAVVASELADEEEPPKKAHPENNTAVLWPRDERSGSGHETSPRYVGAAPVSCAARPRAPPALF